MAKAHEITYSSEWIYHLENLVHWTYYWYQQKIMEGKVKQGQSILEIGKGSGFTQNYLKSKGFKVLSLDIDSEKQPDILRNVLEYDFPDVFDNIIAFEVFEHLPFEGFKDTIKKISNSCRNYFFLSLPFNKKIGFKADFLFPFGIRFNFKLFVKKHKITTKNHFWELEYKNYSESLVLSIIKEEHFELVEKIRYNNIVFYAFKKT